MSEGKQVRLRHTCSCTCFGVQRELRVTSSVGLAKLPSNVSRSTVGVVVISFVCVHRPLEGGLPDLQQQSDNKTSLPDLHLPDCRLQRSVHTCPVACSRPHSRWRTHCHHRRASRWESTSSLPHGRRAARCLRDLTVPKINCTSTRFSRKRVFETWYNDCDARENVSSHTKWIQGPGEMGQEKLITHTKELRTTNSAQRWDDSIYIESMTPYHSTPTVPHTLEEREEKTHCG